MTNWILEIEVSNSGTNQLATRIADMFYFIERKVIRRPERS